MMQKNQLLVIFLLSISFLFSQCEGFNWHDEINELDCNQDDIRVLNQFIKQSSTINMDMDINLSGKIEALELGWQMWEEGRLVHWICSDVPSPWYIYPYNCSLGCEIPAKISDLKMLKKLNLEDNKLRGIVPSSICDMKVSKGSRYWFNIDRNNFVEPLPDCIDVSK